ncbi:MAG: NACHT domain-containing protein [Alphaproteobacteria bacterium]|nr:NACHT domain-containing protein [Alphaproteobacteria bacterium]
MGTQALTRVAVAQLAFHPAARVDGRSPLEDPLFALGQRDSLRPSSGLPPEALSEQDKALHRRVRTAYLRNHGLKLSGIIEACLGWGVRVLVLPEYSVPWELLPALAAQAGDMVVIAGTHTVERAARRGRDGEPGVYRSLGWDPLPRSGEAVCPVLHGGRLVALQPKLNAAVPEKDLRRGKSWATVQVPGVPGPLGVLICLDFLFRESPAHQQTVTPQLDLCRYLAVPALTPGWTRGEFGAKGWEDARRYGRPVLLANGAEGGGSTVFVDEGRPEDLRAFPSAVGWFEPGDEGVLVADVDLGFTRAGRSTRYGHHRHVVPVALAGLGYRARPAQARWLSWLDEHAELLARDDDDALDALIDALEHAESTAKDAAALMGRAHERRMRRLFQDLEGVTRMEELRRFTREVPLPEAALPLPALRAALARGAGETVWGWMAEVRGEGLDAVEARLRDGAALVRKADAVEWTDGAIAEMADLAGLVEGGSPEVADSPAQQQLPPPLRDVPLRALRRWEEGGFAFEILEDVGDVARRAHDRALKDTRDQTEAPPLKVVRWKTLQEHVLLERAKGSEACLLFIQDAQQEGGLVPCLVREDGRRRLLIDVPEAETTDRFREALQVLRLSAFPDLRVETLPLDQLRDAALNQIGRFEGAHRRITEFRKLRLQQVGGQFVDPTVQPTAQKEQLPGTACLDAWTRAASGQSALLLLGEFGAGKSTLLAEWCHRQWQAEGQRKPILVNLAEHPASADPWEMLLSASGAENTTANRAALKLLILLDLLLPVFDGFDEMATRVRSSEVTARLSELLSVAADGGKVILSSRDHYFSSDTDLGRTLEAAVRSSAVRVTQVRVLLFDDDQVRELVRKIHGRHSDASRQALRQIENTYDLKDLAYRPLLLGMVLTSLDRLDHDARVGTADIYEAYLDRWLEHTHVGEEDLLSDDDKRGIAEALAESLWRSGASGASLSELKETVRGRLGRWMPEDVEAWILREVHGGSFIVRDGEERFRFAHKSFLEFFLARGLVAGMGERPAELLTTHPLTPEVAAFVGEILRISGEVRGHPVVEALSGWLTKGRRTQGPPEGSRVAAANALRLLRGLKRWASSTEPWVPLGADLRSVELVREDLRGLSLRKADLSDADLTGADLRDADLGEALFRRTRLVAARLCHSSLRDATFEEADLSLTEADQVQVDRAKLQRVRLDGAAWTRMSGGLARGVLRSVTGGWAWPSRLPLPGVSRQVGCQPHRLGHKGPIWAAAWDPDGQRILTAGSDGALRVWDPRSSQATARCDGHNSSILVAAWDPDGQRILTAGIDSILRVWDPTSGEMTARCDGHNGVILAAAWDPDGQRILSAGDDGTLRVWDPRSGEMTARCDGHNGRVLAAVWDPDGRRILTAGEDGTLRVWDPRSGEVTTRCDGHDGRVLAAAWDPDGRRILSAGDDGTLRVWDPRSGEMTARFDGHSSPIWVAAWDPNGQRIITADDDGTLRVWDPRSGEMTARCDGHDGPVYAAAWGPDGQRILTAGEDGTLRVWDPRSGEMTARCDGHDGSIRAAVWDPDGQRILSAGSDGALRVWDPRSGEMTARCDGNNGWIHAAAWDPDGQRILTAGSDGTLRVWDPLSGELTARCDGHDGSIRVAAWDPDGQRILSAGDDGTLRVWDPRSGELTARFDGHNGSIRVAAWDPDGQRILSAGSDGTLRVWNPRSGELTARCDGHNGWIHAAAWDPDGRRILTAGHDGTLRVWDPRSGEMTARFDGHNGWIRAAWDPDGQRILSAGYDGTLRVWDPRSGEMTARVDGHTGPIWVAAWDPDGQRVLTTDADGTLRVWDPRSGEMTARCDGHDGSIRAAWDPDGQRILTAGSDGTLRVWDPRSGALRATVSVLRDGWLTSTPGGFFVGSELKDARWLRLDVPNPRSPGSVLLSPLAGLRELLHRPDKVKAALAGDLSGDDARETLAELGPVGEPWDGEVRVDVPVEPGALDEAAPEDAEDETRSAVFAETIRPRLEWETILGHLDAGTSVVLLGPRRAGKTTLARHLVTGWSGWALHVDLEGRDLATADALAAALTPELRHAESPAEALLQQLTASERPLLVLDGLWPLQDADENVLSWITRLSRSGARLLLLGTAADWYALREQATATPSRSLPERLAVVELGPLDDAEAEALFEQLVSNALELSDTETARLRDGTTRWVLERVGGWPYYVRVMAEAVVHEVRAGRRRALVESAGVTDLYEQHLIRDPTGSFRARWVNMPLDARARLWPLLEQVQGGQPPPLKDLDAALRERFEQAGLLTQAGVWLKDKPFWDWMGRNRDALAPPTAVRLFTEAMWRVVQDKRATWRVVPRLPGDRRQFAEALVLARPTAPDAATLQALCEATRALPEPGLAVCRALFLITPPLETEAWRVLTAHGAQDVRIIELSEPWMAAALEQKRARRALTGLLRVAMLRDDPFAVSVPVQAPGDFFLRRRPAQALRRDLERGQSIGLFGLRKIGKTSLASWLLRHHDGLTVSVDCQRFSDRGRPLLEALPRLLREAACARLPRVDWPEFRSGATELDLLAPAIGDYIEQILDLYRARTGRDAPLLLHLDEVDRLVHAAATHRGEHLREYEVLFGLLRGLGQLEPRRVLTVISGFSSAITSRDRALGDGIAGNPAYRYFAVHRLGPMERERLDEMMTSLGARVGLSFSTEALDAVMRWSGGHPWLARVVGSQALHGLGERSGLVELGADAIDAAAARVLDDGDLRTDLRELLDRVDEPGCAERLRAIAAAGPGGLEMEPPSDDAAEDWALTELLVQREGRWFIFAELLAAYLRRLGG